METTIWKRLIQLNPSDVLNTLSENFLPMEVRYYLSEKFFGHRVPFPMPENEYFVNWTTFCKQPLEPREFIFWEWIYAALKVTREHFKNSFYEGRIIGFIDKKKVEQKLEGTKHRTFILRFFDSEIGANTSSYTTN
ncbi:hypothetical protein PVAND_006487 [Polypedilum vanderplanki]|uniref:Signal transducer and activator of transcription linker domain-containing protein n=1 Tax=Polypedilum vanderplanki TaxID=319348 RepID=A0A9J6C437_POLVA|nr:hypothetical protein PVAND_006487 [Polypedilum vanderplanki]